MHWFKILLLCLIGANVLLALYKSSKGEHIVINKSWEAALTATLELLLLFGVLFYV